MERRPDPSIPAILWLCAAAVVHYSSYQGASSVASVGYDRLELRQFAAAARSLVRAPDNTMEVTFVDPTAPEIAPTETPEPVSPPRVEPKKPDEKKPDEKKPDEKKPDEKKPDEKKPDEKKLDLLKPPPVVVPPPAPPPPPPPDKRVAIKQHVEDKDQKDNPDAKQIADDANHVKEETQARITSHDQDDKNPSPGTNVGPSREVGNADKTKVADSEERPGSEKEPSGEKSKKSDPVVQAPQAPKTASLGEVQPNTTTPGQNGRIGPAEPARPAPKPTPTTPTPPPATAPDTKNDNKGSYVINPFRGREDVVPSASASVERPAPIASAPVFVLPKLGGAPGRKRGVNFNLTPGTAIAAIGVETIRREREEDGQRRKSAHRGNWKGSPIDKWRASIENYVASVKQGNTTALNAARVPFATYLNHIHNRLHPIFGDNFLESLESLPKEHPLNRHLVTFLEVVLEGDTGRILRMGITKTSGVTAFDIGALDSMERASGGAKQGFGKAPAAIWSPDGNVYLHWEFHRPREIACTTANARPYILKTAPATPSPRPPSPPEVPKERGETGQSSGAKQGHSG